MIVSHKCLAQSWKQCNSAGVVDNGSSFNWNALDFSITGTVDIIGPPPNGASYSPHAGPAVPADQMDPSQIESFAEGYGGATYSIDEEANETAAGYMKYTGTGIIPASQIFLVTTYTTGSVVFMNLPWSTAEPSYASASATDLTFGGGAAQAGTSVDSEQGLITSPPVVKHGSLVKMTPYPTTGIVSFIDKQS